MGPVVAAVLLLAAAGCDQDQDAGVIRWWGGTGQGKGQFSYPRAMTFGRGDRLYVVDKAARIQCFTRQGRYLFEWRMPQYKRGKPIGITVDKAGRVYVADTHYNRVMVYSPDGRTLLRQFGTNGTGPGQFIFVTDVLVADDGTIFVGEYGGNDRISKFGPDGRFLLAFGDRNSGPAALNRPAALAMGPDGVIYVADACNHRICRFDTDGHFLGQFGGIGEEPGMLRYPYDIDVASDGTIWVAEYGNNRIQQFSPEGKSLRVWGTAGRRIGQLAYPWGVLVGDAEIYVLDSGNNRVQVVRR